MGKATSRYPTRDIKKLKVGGKMLVTTRICPNTTLKSARRDLFQHLSNFNGKMTIGPEYSHH